MNRLKQFLYDFVFCRFFGMKTIKKRRGGEMKGTQINWLTKFLYDFVLCHFAGMKTITKTKEVEMKRKTGTVFPILLVAIMLLAGMVTAQIKYPVVDDGTALSIGMVVTVDGTNPNQIVAADGPARSAEIIGVITAVQNVGGTDYYLVKTEGYVEIATASFTPGTRLTCDANGDMIAATGIGDVLVGVAVSATRVQILIDDRLAWLADSALWADSALYADSAAYAQYADSSMYSDSALWADSAGWAEYSDSALWADSALYADSAAYAQYADSSMYADSALWADSSGWAAHVHWDSIQGTIVLDQVLDQVHDSTLTEFDTNPTVVLTNAFTAIGDSIQLTANVVVSDEYSVTPNYNGAKIRVEIYDLTNTTVLKYYTVFLRDSDWYEIKEVSLTHVMDAPGGNTTYQVRCYANGWGNGGRFIKGDLTILALQN